MKLLKKALRTLFEVIAAVPLAILVIAYHPPISVVVCCFFGLLLAVGVLCVCSDKAVVRQSARTMINRHNIFAMTEAATYAERLYEDGDRRGANTWNRVVVEIARLQRVGAASTGERVNP